MGIDLRRERVPDSTTLLKIRRLVETHQLWQALFAKVGEILQSQGLKVGAGAFDLSNSCCITERSHWQPGSC